MLIRYDSERWVVDETRNTTILFAGDKITNKELKESLPIESIDIITKRSKR